jgi:metal-responsive CopG/Arc/MetJ family transcriptional regulator
MRAKYTNVCIPDQLLAEVDTIVKSGKRGYSSRAEFVKEAIREKLDRMKE